MPDDEDEEEDDEDEVKEVLLSLAKILETVIGQREYLIKLKGTGPQGQDQVLIYEDRELAEQLSSYKHAKALYKSFAFGINALITKDDSFKI